MAIVNGIEKLYSLSVTKRFGKPQYYGEAEFGVSFYGDDEPMSGIYSRKKGKNGTVISRERHYFPKNPRTIPQQNWRAIFRDGVVEWKNLTEYGKSVYNKEAVKYQISGFNLFMRRWLYDK